MKKCICICLFFCLLCLCYGCGMVDMEVGAQKTPHIEPSPTEIIERYVLPLSFNSKAQFQERVVADHLAYEETQALSDHKLECIQYYFDFILLPEAMEFREITAANECNYLSVTYQLKDKQVILTWFRADFGEGYNHLASSKAETEGMSQRLIDWNGQTILEVEHRASESAVFDHNSYHWEQDGAYLNLIVEKDLVEQYGAEAFLSVKKVSIDFCGNSPAVVVIPTPLPATPSPNPAPDAESTMPPPEDATF